VDQAETGNWLENFARAPPFLFLCAMFCLTPPPLLCPSSTSPALKELTTAIQV
jgi:hypothetical protein